MTGDALHQRPGDEYRYVRGGETVMELKARWRQARAAFLAVHPETASDLAEIRARRRVA